MWSALRILVKCQDLYAHQINVEALIHIGKMLRALRISKKCGGIYAHGINVERLTHIGKCLGIYECGAPCKIKKNEDNTLIYYCKMLYLYIDMKNKHHIT